MANTMNVNEIDDEEVAKEVGAEAEVAMSTPSDGKSEHRGKLGS